MSGWQPYAGPVLDRVELRGDGWQTAYHDFRERWLPRWKRGHVLVLAARDGSHLIVVRIRDARGYKLV